MPMSHNGGQVLRGVTEALSKFEVEKMNLVKKITLTALGDAQTLSPVDTGLFRGSHDLTIAEPSSLRTTPSPAKRQPGDPPIPEFVGYQRKRTEEALTRLGTGVQPKQLDGLVIYLSNNLEYAQALENGHSQQAPTGVYRIVREKAEQRWARAVAALRGSDG